VLLEAGQRDAERREDRPARVHGLGRRQAPSLLELAARRLGARRPSLTRRQTAAVLAAVVTAGALYLFFWALTVGSHQPDEQQYVWLARWIAQDPWPAAVNFTEFVRGLQRLEVWVLSVPLAFLPSPGALVAGHALNAVAFASTAVPVFLLTRRLGIPRGGALVVAACSVAVPWSVVGTAFLTENVALPATAWAVLAFYGLVDRPSDRAGALALVAVLVAGLARTSLLFLAAVPVGVIALEALTGPRAGLLRRHRVVLAGLGLAVAAFLVAKVAFPSPLRTFSGATVYEDPGFDPVLLLERCGFFLARLAAGTGFLPLAFALGWGASALLRPADPRDRGFAAVAAGTAAVVLLPVASFTIGVPGTFPERYLLPLAPLPFVGAALALHRRRTPPAALLGGGLAVAILVAVARWKDDPGAYDAFVQPAQRFFALTVGDDTRLVAAVAVVVAATAVALLERVPRLRRRRAAIVAGLAVVGFGYQAAIVQSTMRSFADAGGERHGASPATRAWVDDAIYGRGRALLLGSGVGNATEFQPAWADVEFWNTSVDGTVSTTVPGALRTSVGDVALTVAVDERTGALSDGDRLPRYLVAHRTRQLGLRARVVARAEHLPLDLLELVGRPVALWRVLDVHLDGWMTEGEDARLQIFPPSAQGAARCLVLRLQGPPGLAQPMRFAVRGARATPSTGALAADQAVQVRIPLGTRRTRLLTVHADGGAPLPDGRAVGPHVEVTGPAPCAAG
jgi:hypothetical protein